MTLVGISGWYPQVCGKHSHNPHSHNPHSHSAAEQLHIAYGDTADSMVVAWATKGNTTCTLAARYRVVGSDNPHTWLEAAPADNRLQGAYTKHRTTLRGLAPGIRYEYSVEGEDGVFVTSSFSAQRTDTDWSPRIVMFGDLGWSNNQLLPYLGEESAAGAIDAIVLFGDMV